MCKRAKLQVKEQVDFVRSQLRELQDLTAQLLQRTLTIRLASKHAQALSSVQSALGRCPRALDPAAVTARLLYCPRRCFVASAADVRALCAFFARALCACAVPCARAESTGRASWRGSGERWRWAWRPWRGPASTACLTTTNGESFFA